MRRDGGRQNYCGFPKWGEERHQQSRRLVGQEAVAGARVRQKVLGRNGVLQEDEVTTRELSCEWPQETLDGQPGTRRSAVGSKQTAV